MAFQPIALWFPILGGQNSQQIEALQQSKELVEMSQAQNVLADLESKLTTAPGFSKVRSTAILNSPPITGLFHMGDLADTLVIGNGTTGELCFDTANPPVDNTDGTPFTAGGTTLLRGDFHEDKLIIVSNARDLPQTITAASARADLGGTPPYGIDYKVFGRRGLMASPLHGGTTYRNLVSFNSANDDHDAWTNPVTTNALSFGRYGSDVKVVGLEIFQDFCMAFTNHNVFPIYATPSADLPLAFQSSVFNERGGGPTNAHAVVAANDSIYWLSQNFDVKHMRPDRSVKSIGYAVQPFLRGLNDSRRVYTVGGWEPQYRLVVWAVSDGSDTTNKTLLCLKVDTGQFYFVTRSRNAFCNRLVSGEIRLIGGGYSGFFYNEFDSSTTGDLDNAASAIDADAMTPRHHLGLPGCLKKISYVAVEVDPIGSESITFQYQLNDDQSWTSFPESPYTVSGTDYKTVYLRVPGPFDRIRLRFRDANSGERFRVLRYGFPKPSVITQRISA